MRRWSRLKQAKAVVVAVARVMARAVACDGREHPRHR